MATVETIYMGGLRTEATHVQSGTKIVTDAPTDNHGKGESFSPTVDGTRLSITKVMAADPRRIGEIVIDVHFPSAYEPKQRKLLENAAATCPVAKTLHPDCKQTIRYFYAE